MMSTVSSLCPLVHTGPSGLHCKSTQPPLLISEVSPIVRFASLFMKDWFTFKSPKVNQEWGASRHFAFGPLFGKVNHKVPRSCQSEPKFHEKWSEPNCGTYLCFSYLHHAKGCKADNSSSRTDTGSVIHTIDLRIRLVTLERTMSCRKRETTNETLVTPHDVAGGKFCHLSRVRPTDLAN